jgi:hypothetical protein
MRQITINTLGFVFVMALNFQFLNAQELPDLGSPLTEMHPQYEVETIRPLDWTKGVADLDFLPDGKMVVGVYTPAKNFGEVPPASDIYAFENVIGNSDRSRIIAKKIGSGFVDALGIATVGNRIFVTDRTRVTELVGDHKGIDIDVSKPLWTGFTVGTSFNMWSHGGIHKQGSIYVALGLNWPEEAPIGDDRDMLWKVDIATGKAEAQCGGLRSPSGLALGPEGEIFAAENQGGWKPADQLMQLNPNRFYGYRKTPAGKFDNLPVTHPAVWLPHGEVARSPCGPAYIQNGNFGGLYNGQMIMGDIHYGGVQRIFLEKVAGRYQGAVFRFMGGLESASASLKFGPDGHLYMAGLGGPHTDWRWKDKMYGLQRIKRKANPPNVFEMLAIRNSGQNAFDIEFTDEVSNEASNVSNWLVKSWTYKPTKDYYGPKIDGKTHSITKITIGSNRKHISLEFSGIDTNRVYAFKPNFKSSTSKDLWTNEGWYTLNAFGPGIDAPTPIVHKQTQLPRQSYGGGLLPHMPQFQIGKKGFNLNGRRKMDLGSPIEK